MLSWEYQDAILVNKFILPEYDLTDVTTTENITCYADNFPSPRIVSLGQKGEAVCGMQGKQQTFNTSWTD